MAIKQHIPWDVEYKMMICCLEILKQYDKKSKKWFNHELVWNQSIVPDTTHSKIKNDKVYKQMRKRPSALLICWLFDKNYGFPMKKKEKSFLPPKRGQFFPTSFELVISFKKVLS